MMQYKTKIAFLKNYLIQVILASALFAAALARPDGPRYGAAPVYEELPPQPFAYQYGVADDYSKANFRKEETQDNYGKLTMSLYPKQIADCLKHILLLCFKNMHVQTFYLF